MCRMRPATFIATILVILMTSATSVYGYFFNYPRDGQFKKQPARMDVWYYAGDPDWEIKAPDKWQHMMGSYASAELFSTFLDDKLAGGMVFALGLLKEVEDGYREGWSMRDIFMDAAGVGASLLNNDKYSLWCNWDNDNVKLMITFSLK